MYKLKLYVVGRSARSKKAENDLKSILDETVGRDRYHLEVINLLKKTQRAETDRILATPTVIRTTPAPSRRVIGDLSDREKVLAGLEIRQ